MLLTIQAVIDHSFNPSTQEAEAGRSLSSRPAWFYRMSSRTGWATQKNPVLENKKQKKNMKVKNQASNQEINIVLVIC